jgi:hypothetical protein
MFDLDERIRSWRQTLPPALANRPEVAEELESHLRDEVDRLARAGRTPEQAWEAAVAQLGEPATLAAEFDKAHRPAWLPARLSVALLVGCALLLGVFLASRAVQARLGVLLASHVFAITIGYLAALTVGFVAMSGIVGRAVGRFGPRQSDAFRRIGSRMAAAAVALTLVGILLGAFWSRGHLGPYWQWDAREVGGLCVLAWSGVLFSCLRWRAVSASSAMLAGVIGNVVVLLSWLGPPLVDGRASHGFPSWYAPVLCVAVMTHLAWAYAGMLPPGWLRRTADGR